MTVHIKLLRSYRCNEDPDGNAVRELPRGLTLSLSGEEEYIGLRAIAEGAADPTVDLDETQLHRVEVIKASLAGDEAKVAELLGDSAPGDDGDGGEDVPPAAAVAAESQAEPAKAKPRRGKSA